MRRAFVISAGEACSSLGEDVDTTMLEKRQPHKLQDLAQMFHRLQHAAIRDVIGLRDGE